MNRPLQYSTTQRQNQYETIRSAGLPRADYRAAIKQLNKAEQKYRTAQKLKEKKEAQRDAERQAAAAAAAVANAAARLAAERKKKYDKNKKRRERNAAKKLEDAKKDKKKGYINQVVSNMKNRIEAVYQFADAVEVGISNVELIELIARNSDNGMWLMYYDTGMYYTLSDQTRNKIVEYMVKNLVVETGYTESDGKVITETNIATSVGVSPLEPKHKNKKDNGKFFKYHNKTDINLTRCGIWSSTVPSNYDDTCLIVALRNGGLSVKKEEIIKRMLKNRQIPICDLPKICNAAQIQIRIKTEDTANNSKRVFGKEYDEVYHIGILIEHYFIIEPTYYTSYAIKNYNEVKDVPNYTQIYGKKKTTYMRDDKHYIDTFDVIKLMLQDKDTFFNEITLEDKFIASTQFYDKVNDEITHLDFDVEKCIRPIKIGKPKDNKMQNLFFDFETNPNGEHKAYLCRTYDGSSSREFIGDNCGLQMLFSLKRNTRLIAHNATYDFRFLIQYLRNVNELVIN